MKIHHIAVCGDVCFKVVCLYDCGCDCECDCDRNMRICLLLPYIRDVFQEEYSEALTRIYFALFALKYNNVDGNASNLLKTNPSYRYYGDNHVK